MQTFRIGRHINIRNGLLFAPTHANDLGCTIFQIFLGSPQQILSPKRSDYDLTKFGLELAKFNIQMVIHASYTINLCHQPKSKRFVASMKSLVQDLNAAAVIGPNCLGVIIHMGKNIPDNNLSTKQAIMNYTNGLRLALNQTPTQSTIILETGASTGSEICSTIDSLSKLYALMTKAEQSRIKFCIDTCHIWASGYDISTEIGVKNFFKEFDEKIGLKNVLCIHLNDSKTKLNSHVDRHADLGYGFIKSVGLKYFVRFAKKYSIPIIMETPLDSINKRTNREITFAEELAMVNSWL